LEYAVFSKIEFSYENNTGISYRELILSETFDYDAVVKEIRAIQDQNINKVRALGNAGKAIDPGAVANIKIDTFITMFLDENAQASFVLAMEKALQESLDEALSAVRQQQITEGVRPSGLTIPKR
jgi:hypothetical protein